MRNLKLVLLFSFIFSVSLLAQESSASLLGNKVKNIDVRYAKGLRSFRLKAVLLTSSAWSQEKIVEEIENTNDLFEQCGIQIRGLDLYFEDQKNHFDKQKDLVFYAVELDASGFYKFRQPLVVFADSAKHGHKDPYGYSYVEKNKSTYLDNIMVIGIYSFPQSKKDLPSVLGHELGHVLLRSGHVNYGNFLSSGPSGKINKQITNSQCGKINSSGLLDDLFEAFDPAMS